MAKNAAAIEVGEGAISHGTLRTADLISSFIGAADDYGVTDGDAIQVAALRHKFDGMGPEEFEEYGDTEDAQYDLEILIGILENAAPDGFYFGAHEGDGSDFGFWAIDEE